MSNHLSGKVMVVEVGIVVGLVVVSNMPIFTLGQMLEKQVKLNGLLSHHLRYSLPFLLYLMLGIHPLI